MERLERFKKAVEYLKTRADEATNEGVSRLLRYSAENYISDVIGESKPINKQLLKRMVEYSINPDWVETGKGKMLSELKQGESLFSLVNEDAAEYNKVLPLGDLRITLNDYVSLLKEMASKAEEREREYLSIIKNKLISIDASSKEMAEDISALTIEVQAEHRAMMDTLDKAAGYKIGTTRGAAHTVELASQQERAGKGKQTKADKQD